MFFNYFHNKEREILYRNNELVKQVLGLKDYISKYNQEDIINFIQNLRTSYIQKKYKGDIIKDNKIKLFAIIREVSRRMLNEEHRPCQILAGLCLTEGHIIEMKTGEGKTLSSILPSIFFSLYNKGCHVITVNDYLAKRDCLWMSPVYNYMNISSDFIQSEDTIYKKQDAYKKDITYITSTNAGFDYLKDTLQINKNLLMQRGLEFCIVDEADNVLIDNARVDYVISGECDSELDKNINSSVYLAQKIYEEMTDDCFKIESEYNNFTITDIGFNKIEELLIKYVNYDNSYNINTIYDTKMCHYLHFIEKAIRANKILKKNKDYVVIKDKVIIVDQLTGRISINRKYTAGLHQAIEAKERVAISKLTKTLSSISPSYFFKSYNNLCGMTGTAFNDKNEFFEIYGTEVVRIPTNKAVQRKNHHDILFATKKDKFEYALNIIKYCHKKNQPILIGTTSIADSEELSKILFSNGIQHSVLNAKNHEKESKIIAEAGTLGAVTIATNMAGRGTDIKLGGSITNLVEKSEFSIINNIEKISLIRNEIVKLGGLYVLGLERHENRRIDDQLIGRCSRDGDPGESRFLISLEDELFKKKKFTNMTFDIVKGENFSGEIVDNIINKLQSIEEAGNFSNRKYLYLYDVILSVSRDSIFRIKRNILFADNYYLIKRFINLCEEFFAILEKLPLFSLEKTKTIEKLFGIDINFYGYDNDVILNKVKLEINKAVTDNLFEDIIFKEQFIQNYLKYINTTWVEYMDLIENLKIISSLKQIGKEDPLLEFSSLMSNAFEKLLLKINSEFVKKVLYLSRISNNEEKTKIHLEKVVNI